jgi:hypothetical protein
LTAALKIAAADCIVFDEGLAIGEITLSPEIDVFAGG